MFGKVGSIGKDKILRYPATETTPLCEKKTPICGRPFAGNRAGTKKLFSLLFRYIAVNFSRMKIAFDPLCIFIVAIFAAFPSRPATAAAPGPQDYPFKPVPFTAVHLNDLFWAPRLETNRTVTIPYAFGKCEESGRMYNFERAAAVLRGE